MNYEEFMKIYHTEHYCCPVCHSKNFTSTLVGYAYDPSKPEEYKDLNSCHCYTCGWEGSRHKLVPRPKKTAYKIGILISSNISSNVCQNYDNKLYSEEEAKKLAKELQNNDLNNYYYPYEIEIHQDIE